MKGFIVVNRINEVQFIDSDTEFTNHINRQAQKQGLLETTSDGDELNPDVVMQLFSPLFMSQWFMVDQARNPCTSITCDNGFLFVFKQFEEILIIAINGDETESEDFLSRKISVFLRMIGFLFGPVSEEIGYPKIGNKPERWKFLRDMIHTWERLVENEQSFLMEAVERLHVNQLVSEKCIELLENTVYRLQQNSSEKLTQHALLLVNSKLLSLFSNRNAQDLQAGDILSIILLTQQLFPSGLKLEDFLSYPSSTLLQASPFKTQISDTTRMKWPEDESYLTIKDDSDRADENGEQYLSASEVPYMTSESRSHDSSDTVTPSGSSVKTGDGTVTVSNSLTKTDDGTTTVSGSVTKSVDTTEIISGGSKNKDDSTSAQSLSDSDKSSASSESLEDERLDTIRPDSLDISLQESYPAMSEMNRSETFHTPTEVMATGNAERGDDSNEATGMTPVRVRSKTEENIHGNLDAVVTKVRTTTDVSTVNFDEDDDNSEGEYLHQPVFLATANCPQTPHNMHIVQIYPGILLVVLSQMNRSHQAVPICQILPFLKDIKSGKHERFTRIQGPVLYDVINKLFNNLLSSMKKSKGPLEKICKDLKTKWESDSLKTSLINYLERSSSDAEIPPVLERALEFLYKKMKELFFRLYLTPRPLKDDMRNTFIVILDKLQLHLKDFKDFLAVKAQRNIAMTSYMNTFPGLVHFIYVDRRNNQITAPAINILPSSNEKMDATKLLKDKIWSMSQWMLKKLRAGYTTVTARQGDFYFSYFLWFQDRSGNLMPIQQPFQPSRNIALPGVMTGGFYRAVIKECFPNAIPGSVHCYELFMMHIGLVDTQYVAAHCRELAAMLWESAANNFITSSNGLWQY